MSGGVDSSVAAALLAQQGYEVIGITMSLFQSVCQIKNPRNCCSLQAFEDAYKVAKRIGISYHVLDLKEEFEKEVIKYFLDEYLNGKTPNPCIKCNEKIKFGVLLDKVKKLKADYLATGHYAKIEYCNDRKHYILKRGLDLRKDQSYVLFGLRQEQLQHILFPLGEYTKEDVRRMAKELGLPVHNKPESQEICFIPDNNYPKFFKDRGISDKAGPIINKQGRILGKHKGIFLYTIGQRKGLGIAKGHPLYVISIIKDKNAIIVGEKEDLFQDELIASNVNWISETPLNKPIIVKAKIRYAHKEAPASLTLLSSGQVKVKFIKPQLSITPGQAVVFYQDDAILGGGWIG
jgi:tRNA-specific 2-thiouridylase